MGAGQVFLNNRSCNPEEASEQMRDCFNNMDWDILCSPHGEDIESLTCCINKDEAEESAVGSEIQDQEEQCQLQEPLQTCCLNLSANECHEKDCTWLSYAPG